VHGDFSLNPLAYREDVSRVLIQQGRVQLDSDANEQTESLLRFIRGLAFDVIGAHGGVGNSFDLIVDPEAPQTDLLIKWGVYYVDGIRCVNYPRDRGMWQWLLDPPAAKDGLPFKAQPQSFPPEAADWTLGKANKVLLYLDCFERHLSAAEDPDLTEVALLGPDTASRAVVVWRVRSMPAAPFDIRLKGLGAVLPIWDAAYLALNLMLQSGARLRARAVVSEPTDPCSVAPDARYRGTDNRLFRVEIHDPTDPDKKEQPTFKWSPDNGAIVYPVRDVEGKTVHLDSLGRDDRTAIRVNDWVEVVDDKVLLMARAHPLLQVVDVRPHEMTVTLSEEPTDNAGSDPKLHPILRRWAGPPVALREGTSAHDAWFELADGVEVKFSRADVPDAAYRTGDYWLIPTRTATGDVVWPHDIGEPREVPPHGVEHHYAPLLTMNPKTKTVGETYRRHFDPSAKV
jgi:uncharacterized protein DUF6519